MLNLMTLCWRNADAVAKTKLSASTSINGSSSELLRIAMNVGLIAQRAIKTVIQCIQVGLINGRSAIYCISEVRISLLSRDFYQKLIDSEGLLDAIENIRVIAELCIKPFFAANKNALHLQEASICLDLFPAAINQLSSLRRRVKRSRKYEIEVLDTFLSNQWHSIGFLPLCCTVCELYNHLKTRHLQKFKVKFTLLLMSHIIALIIIIM